MKNKKAKYAFLVVYSHFNRALTFQNLEAVGMCLGNPRNMPLCSSPTFDLLSLELSPPETPAQCGITSRHRERGAGRRTLVTSHSMPGHPVSRQARSGKSPTGGELESCWSPGLTRRRTCLIHPRLQLHSFFPASNSSCCSLQVAESVPGSEACDDGHGGPCPRLIFSADMTRHVL